MQFGIVLRMCFPATSGWLTGVARRIAFHAAGSAKAPVGMATRIAGACSGATGIADRVAPSVMASQLGMVIGLLMRVGLVVVRWARAAMVGSVLAGSR